MPFDGSGKHHLSHQMAMNADKKPPAAAGGAEPEAGGEHEPGSIVHHMAAMHAEHGGKMAHMHMAEHGGVTTHHVAEDGKVQGPHEHDSMDAAMEHVKGAMGGEDGQDMQAEHAGKFAMREPGGY